MIKTFLITIVLLFISISFFAQSKKEQLEYYQFKIDSINQKNQIEFIEWNHKFDSLNLNLKQIENQLTELHVKLNQSKSELIKVKNENDKLNNQIKDDSICSLSYFFSNHSLKSIISLIEKCDFSSNTNYIYGHLNKVILFEIMKRDNFHSLSNNILWAIANKMVIDDCGNDYVDFFKSTNWMNFAIKYSNPKADFTSLELDVEDFPSMIVEIDRFSKKFGKYLLMSLNEYASGSEYRLSCLNLENDTINELRFDFTSYNSLIYSQFKSDDVRLNEIDLVNNLYYFHFSVFNHESEFWPDDSGQLKLTLNVNNEISTIQYCRKDKNRKYLNWTPLY